MKGIEVFCSSDPTDLLPGSIWPTEIQTALEASDIFLLLATSRSLSRPWVWFECGTFWFKRKKLIPLCLGEVRKNELPMPLSERMALNVDDLKDFDTLFSTIEGLTSIKREPLDIQGVVNSLRDKEKIVSARAATDIAGWSGVSWDDKFLSYDGPIEGLTLIEDDVFQQSMWDALVSADFQPRLGSPDRLSRHVEKGHRIIYLTDRSSWRRKISRGSQVLLAKPKASKT